VELLQLHPEVYRRDCSLCLKYAWDEEKGVMNKDGRGNPIERPPLTYAPCRKPKGSECPKGCPEKPNTLTNRSRMLWRRFQECKLTGRWPEDHWTIALYAQLDDLVRRCDEIKASRSRTAEMQIILASVIGR